MVQRCTNPAATYYERYGGRGVRVCEAWRASFATFLREVGPRPSAEHSLDRIDPNGHYEPSNVRWTTLEMQRRNRRDPGQYIVVGVAGERRDLAAWADISGFSVAALRWRYHQGWSPQEIVFGKKGRSA